MSAPFDIAERKGLLLVEAFTFRHNPQTQQVTELIAEGAVGRVRLVNAAFSVAAKDSPSLRLSSPLAGKALMAVGCYCVSGARLIAGEPARVTAEQQQGRDGIDTALVATVHFSGDTLAHVYAGLAAEKRAELEVVGDGGSLFPADPWRCSEPKIEIRRPDGFERVEIPLVDSHRVQVENMSAAIRGDAPLLLGRTDAVGQARTLEALHRAAETGLAVEFDG